MISKKFINKLRNKAMYNSNIDSRIKRLLRKIKGIKRSNYERSLIARGWYDMSIKSNDNPVIIGGCGRSGTTLLREIINRHQNIFCGPETSMFGLPFWPQNIASYWELSEKALNQQVRKSENLIRFAEKFYREHAKESGKIRWADKTPNNIRVIDKILTWFPKAKFIHMMRDGRDVSCSLRKHPKEKYVKGRLVPLQTNNPIGFCANRWLNDTLKGLAFRGHPRYMEIKYEDLVTNTKVEMQRVCQFIGEEFDECMLETGNFLGKRMKKGRLINNENADKKITTRSIGRWRNDLNQEERYEFANIAGELLISAGYTNNHSWIES